MNSTVLIFAFILAGSSLCQSQANPSLQLDTISIRGSLLRDQQLPNIKFDSVVVELYLSGSRLAVLPNEYHKFVNMELIHGV